MLWYDANGMKHYRLNSVELNGDREIPVIVACPQSQLEGVVLTDLNPPESRRVREVKVDDLDLFVTNGPGFEKLYGAVSDSESSLLLGLLQLIEALKHKNPSDLEAASQRLAVSPIKEFREIERQALFNNPGMKLGRLVAKGLRDVRLVLWCKDDGRDTEILPGLHCQDATSALYALVLMRLSGGKGLGACLNCGKFLPRQRRTRKFCSDTCRYKYFMRRNSSKRSKKEHRR